MWTLCFVLLLSMRFLAAAGTAGNWRFQQNGTTGIIAQQAMVVSPTLVLMLDRPANQTAKINNHSAWAALWNLETNEEKLLDVKTNTFCASGSWLSNGSMVSLGGTEFQPVNDPPTPDVDGRMSIRVFEPCTDAAGDGCTLFDDPAALGLSLNKTRWYPSSLRISDGSIMILGGVKRGALFYNDMPENTFEFFPKKDGGAARQSPFLERTVPVNLFPRAFLLPDGNIFIIANNQSIMYNITSQVETVLPDIPNGVRVTNPFDGTATLLPLSPPDYVPEVLVCGGTTSSDQTPREQLSSQDPTSDQCSRIVLTPEGIEKGWDVERMLEPRTMLEFILMPSGQVLLINGAMTGYTAIGSVGDPVGQSNADHPALRPSLYTPSAPLGERISNAGLPSTDIPRMYHSSVTLTPNGNVMLAGSNPNYPIINDTIFNSEFRVEYLNPPYMSVERPTLISVPRQIGFHKKFTVNVSVPESLEGRDVKVALIDLGFSSHAYHSSSRLVFLEAQLSEDRQTLTMLSPPNNNVYPPGPGFLYLTIDEVASKGKMLMVGSGETPPVEFQGVPLPLE